MNDIVDAPKKKGGKGKLLLLILLVLLMAAAGVAGALFATGAIGSDAETTSREDPDRPHLVLKGEDPVVVAAKYAPAKVAEGADSPAKGKGARVPKGGIDLPRPKNVANYNATYFQLPTPFTSNMVDTDSFVQISVAVSTYYDSRVTDALKTHEMALRSAILLVLAQESEMELSTPGGKAALQKKLARLINQVLKEKTGYGGVDNVYFTNFVIQ